MTEKNKSETVVGRKVKNPTPAPTPKPTPSPSLSGVTSGINGRLSEIGIVINGTETMDTVSDFLANLNRKQKLEIANILKENFTVRQLSDINTIISQNFSGLPVANNYKEFISNLKAELIPSDTSANIPVQQIRQVSPESKMKTAEAAYQSVYGKKPSAAELDQANRFLQKMIDVGQTTTSKTVGGKKVVTYTPEYSETRGQLALEEQLKKNVAPTAMQDLQEKQSLDALDKIVKWGG